MKRDSELCRKILIDSDQHGSVMITQAEEGTIINEKYYLKNFDCDYDKLQYHVDILLGSDLYDNKGFLTDKGFGYVVAINDDALWKKSIDKTNNWLELAVGMCKKAINKMRPEVKANPEKYSLEILIACSPEDVERIWNPIDKKKFLKLIEDKDLDITEKELDRSLSMGWRSFNEKHGIENTLMEV